MYVINRMPSFSKPIVMNKKGAASHVAPCTTSHGQVCGLIVVVGCTIVRPGKGCISTRGPCRPAAKPKYVRSVYTCDIL